MDARSSTFTLGGRVREGSADFAALSSGNRPCAKDRRERVGESEISILHGLRGALTAELGAFVARRSRQLAQSVAGISSLLFTPDHRLRHARWCCTINSHGLTGCPGRDVRPRRHRVPVRPSGYRRLSLPLTSGWLTEWDSETLILPRDGTLLLD